MHSPSHRACWRRRYGLVLNEIGMEPVFDSLQTRVLQPIAALLFPYEGCTLDRHHSFVVEYQQGKDLGLDMHTDNSGNKKTAGGHPAALSSRAWAQSAARWGPVSSTVG